MRVTSIDVNCCLRFLETYQIYRINQPEAALSMPETVKFCNSSVLPLGSSTRRLRSHIPPSSITM